jgi:AcrR family transcriptional regulator
VTNSVLVKRISSRVRSTVSATDAHPPSPPTGRRRSTRDRPAKAPLSQEAVIDAALAILKSEGLDAVTMRRVAAALDTGAASLYVYVSGREALLQAMLDRVTATITLEVPDTDRWREQLHGLLERMHAALLAYPGTAALTLADPPTSETVLLVAENLIGILLAGGIEAQDAAWACDILVLLVTAVASEDDVRAARGQSGERQQQVMDEIYANFTALPADRFPLLRAHATQMVTGDSTARFRFAIDVVIDGVLARGARQ